MCFDLFKQKFCSEQNVKSLIWLSKLPVMENEMTGNEKICLLAGKERFDNYMLFLFKCTL